MWKSHWLPRLFLLLALLAALTGCAVEPPSAPPPAQLTLQDVPAFLGEPYVELCGGRPELRI